VGNKTQQIIAENQKEDIQNNPILELATKAEREQDHESKKKRKQNTRHESKRGLSMISV
jgi:uncharacterized membrane protein